MIAADEPGLYALDLDPAEVEARFAWARKRGQPNWLWQDIAPAAWRDALGRIVAATSSLLREDPAARLEGADAEALGLAAYTSGMGPLLGLSVEQGRLSADPAVECLLAFHLRHNRLRMARLRGEARRLAAALSEAGITPTVIKGLHTAFAFFPEPGARPCSDIDLVVRPEEMAVAEEVLTAEGYRAGPRFSRPDRCAFLPEARSRLPRSLAFVHAEDPWSVDLQSSLDRYFSSARPARLQGVAESRSAEPWSESAAARILSQPALILLLAAHASHGFASLTTLRLVELVSVVRADRAAGRLDWPALVDAAEANALLGFVYPALHFAELLAPGTIPLRVLARCAAAAPSAVRSAVAERDLVSVHRVDRWSLAEHFLWCAGWPERFHQLAADVALLKWESGRRTAFLADAARRVLRTRLSS